MARIRPAPYLLAATLLAIGGWLAAAESNPARTHPKAVAGSSQRFIVKMRATTDSSRVQAQASQAGESAATAADSERVRALAGRTGLALRYDRALTLRLHAVQMIAANGESQAATLARLRADPEVEYAVPDRRMYAHATTPNDPRGPAGGGQWYLGAAQPSAINALGAWDITQGSDSIVIAMIDTGVRFEHEDLGRASAGGRLLDGYDFISPDPDNTFTTANDGDGRDADASDPGDWITAADIAADSASCGDQQEDSSWHGTRTAGIVGARTNNAIGVAGITWKGRILPVRALGKCGGYNSDILAGMLWAAGQHVSGVPDNANPAKIINLSLGSSDPCDQASADVVGQLVSLGVLIVASAGNEGGPVDSPANCPGALGVAGLRQAGTKVGFSSLGPEVALAAPAGNCVNPTGACLYSIDTTVNAGTTTPAAATNTYTDQFNANVGTSFSAPIVSGIAGLMLAVNGNLRATHLIARLKEGAVTFPTTSETPNLPACHVPTGSADVQQSECVCNTSVCGAGMANALGAVNAALRPIASIVVQGAVSAGASLTLQGSGSSAANGHSLASSPYTWIRGGATIGSSQSMTVTAPTSGTSTVCLTVKDDAGKQDTARVDITPSAATVSIVAVGDNSCLTTDVSVVATDANASESGDTGTFQLTRTGNASAALTVTVAMSGSAVNGTDYQSIGATVTFGAGAATANVILTPVNNSIVDGSRTAVLTIQGGSGYNVGSPASATVTIADNDSSMSTTSSTSGGGGGGGGALDWATLAALALAVLCVLARGRRRMELATRTMRPWNSRKSAPSSACSKPASCRASAGRTRHT